MAKTLYQTLIDQGVSSGNTFNVQKQLYEKLGSPLGPYKGTYDQNIFLLNKVGSQNYQQILNPPQAAAPAQATAVEPQQSPLQQVNKIIEDTFQKLQNEVTKRFGEYRAGKPFRVDEVLAEKNLAAKEQIDPYYNEKLGDYLLGVTRKINRSTDDTQDLLGELSTDVANYTGRSQVALQESARKAEEGFADSGLFGSGEQLATEGQLKYDTGNRVTDYLAAADSRTRQLKTGLGRTLEDINFAKKGDVRDLERNRLTDISTRAADLTKTAGQQYISGFKASLPPELQAGSGFDLLKDLGIYS